MIHALRFETEAHYREVEAWAKARGVHLTPELLPKTGRIVPGKAAIFLYKTDSSLGLLENLISNPKDSDSEAIDAVVTSILEDAKEMGIKFIMCTTSLPAVISRAARLGFLVNPTPSTILLKVLS